MGDYRSPWAAGAALLALFVAACSQGPTEPAPIVMMGAGPGIVGQAAAPPAAAAPMAARSIIVRPGQSVGGIARDYHVSKQAIIAANHLAPPYKIQMGKPLVIPGAAEPPAATAAQPPATVLAAAPPSPETAPAPPPAAAPAPAAPTAVAAPPPVAEARSQPEIIPLDDPAPAKSAPPPSAAPAATASLAPPPQPEPPPMPLSSAAAAAQAGPPGPAPAAAPLPHGGHFPWPVKGRVVAGYGAAANGSHNDGINIAAARGTPVAAVDSGIVAYAGNELRGYGNLVLVKHTSGWISAYAHCDEVLVKRGDPVSRGQTIAKVGTTGGVSEPQLHFELRRGKQPVDPKGFLAPSPSA